MHTVYITLRIDYEKKDNVDIEKATQTAIDSVVSMAGKAVYKNRNGVIVTDITNCGESL